VAKSRESVSLTSDEFSVDPADERENPLRVGFNHAYLQEQISAALAQLSPRDQLVITHRILNEETLEEVGNRIGMTKEGARLAVLKALKNLRGVMSVDPRDNFI
jgi:RNA polymerase sigma factor (sigma-70 family)